MTETAHNPSAETAQFSRAADMRIGQLSDNLSDAVVHPHLGR